LIIINRSSNSINCCKSITKNGRLKRLYQ